MAYQGKWYEIEGTSYFTFPGSDSYVGYKGIRFKEKDILDSIQETINECGFDALGMTVEKYLSSPKGQEGILKLLEAKMEMRNVIMDYEYENGHVFIYDSHGADTELNNRSGTLAEIISPLEESEYDREEVGDMYKARFLSDGHETDIFADEITDIDRSKYEGLDVYMIEHGTDYLRNYYYNEQSGNVEENAVYDLPALMSEHENSNDGLSFIERFQMGAKNYCYEDEGSFDWFVKEVEKGKQNVDDHIVLKANDDDSRLVEFCEKSYGVKLTKDNTIERE